MKIKERLSRINLPARASMGYLGVSFIGKMVGILITPFFTRSISKEEYGRLILYLTILGGASVICSALTSGSAVYKCLRDFGDKNSDFIKTALLTSSLFSLLICILLFAFLPYLGLDRTLYLPLALQIFFDSVISLGLSRARFHYRYGEVMIISLITSILPAVFSILIIRRYGCGCGARIYSMLFISGVIAVAELIKLLRGGGKPSGKMLKKYLHSALPILPHSLSVALSGQADKLFITTLLGAVSLAKYSVAHSLGISLQFAITALGSALGPWLIRKFDDGSERKIAKVVYRLFSLFCSASLGLILLAPEAMRLLAPKDYLDALYAVAPIALSIPLAMLSYVINVGLVHAEGGIYTSIISASGMAISLLLNYTLIPSFSFLGAGVAVMISQAVQVLLGGYFMRKKRLGRTLTLSSLFPLFMFTLGGAIFAVLFYSSLPCRLLLLIVPAISFLGSLFKSKGIISE